MEICGTSHSFPFRHFAFQFFYRLHVGSGVRENGLMFTGLLFNKSFHLIMVTIISAQLIHLFAFSPQFHYLFLAVGNIVVELGWIRTETDWRTEQSTGFDTACWAVSARGQQRYRRQIDWANFGFPLFSQQRSYPSSFRIITRGYAFVFYSDK